MSSSSPIVVDSSVAVKWFVPEGELHVAEAWALLEGHIRNDAPLTAPTLLRLEVLSALRRRGFDASQLVDAADRLDLVRLEWSEIDASLTRAVAELCVRFSITPYDAAFVALALESDAELVTADERLASAGACKVRRLAV